MNSCTSISNTINTDLTPLFIRTIEPDYHLSVKRGEVRRMRIALGNVFLSQPNVIVSFGQGVNTQVISARPQRGSCSSILVLEYQIAHDAEIGERDLLIHFNRIFLDQRDVLWILNESVAKIAY